MANTKITALADAGGATAADYLYIVDGATSKHVQFDDFEGSLAHDNLSGFVANEHIDWTNATDNFSTTGTIHSNGNITTGGTVDGVDIAGLSVFVTANTLKDTNVDTDLSVTKNATTMTVVSSDGDNAVLVEADTTNAGILGSDKWDEIVANSTKTTYVKTNVKGHIAHGATAATARPSGFTSVEWVGSVEPTNASNGDTWIDTT